MPPRRKNQASNPPADNPATPPADKPDEAPAVGSPAWRRADDVRALQEELEMCKRAGKTERIKAIEAAIKDRKSAPKNRRAPGADEA